VAHTRQVVALLPRGSSIPQGTRLHRRSRCMSSLRCPHFGRFVQPAGGVVVAQRGSALPQATLLYCKRFGKSSDSPDGTSTRSATRLRSPSGYNDVNMVEWPSRRTCPLRRIPGAGEAAARRCSSVTVKDEGLCHTTVHRSIRRMWDRPRSILSRTPVRETGLTICEGKGYAEPHRVVELCRRKAA